MLLNVDQLQKQLDKDEFQEDGSMTAFWVVNNQFQKFINSKFTLDYDSQMTDTYFVEYIQTSRQYERRVNKRQMQTQESKIDTGKALDADLVDTESIRTDSTVQDDSSRSGNDTDADDADIRPIYDEEPMAEFSLIQDFRCVYEKTSLRYDLRWKPTGRIFESVGLRWIPTGKLFDSCTSKVDSEPPHGSNVDIPHIHECKQTLDVSAGTSINVQKEQSLDLSAGTLCNVNKKISEYGCLKDDISETLSKWIH
ncbi:hypothetical protein Tco_0689126 [Tanacetum coccineum]